MIEEPRLNKKNEILDMDLTGKKIKSIMQSKGYSARDIQEYLGLGTVQSIYHWFEGRSMPTIDHFYSLSSLFEIPVDAMLVGSREAIETSIYVDINGRMEVYFERIHLMLSS